MQFFIVLQPLEIQVKDLFSLLGDFVTSFFLHRSALRTNRLKQHIATQKRALHGLLSIQNTVTHELGASCTMMVDGQTLGHRKLTKPNHFNQALLVP